MAFLRPTQDETRLDLSRRNQFLGDELLKSDAKNAHSAMLKVLLGLFFSMYMGQVAQ